MKLTSKQLLEKIIKEEVGSAIGEPQTSSETKSKAQQSFERTINGNMLNNRLSGFKGKGVVGKMWDEIIAHLKMPQEQQRQWFKDLRANTTTVPWSTSENGFVAFYFNQAIKDVQAGLLDPNNAISGTQMEQEQLPIWKAKEDAWELEKQKTKDKENLLSPEEKAVRDAKATERAMYGGDPSKRPWGLGS